MREPAVPSLGECFAFAVPALGIYTAGPLMSLIDAAFVGRGSSVELAALGPASSISDSAPRTARTRTRGSSAPSPPTAPTTDGAQPPDGLGRGAAPVGTAL